jgi:hypothetical protein
MPGGSGEALFARYAYPPNELGHCGPPGAGALLAATTGESAAAREAVRERARRFEGAWAYLCLLAEAAGVDDPLAEEVVAAYWLGGELLDAVSPGALAAMVSSSFGRQPGVRTRLSALPMLGAAGASHAFHVFAVYPWVGLLGNGDVPRSVLDSCRIGWGTVTAVTGGTATVRASPLTWDGTALGLGEERAASYRMLDVVSPGDVVSLHWDWICDVLTEDSRAELDRRTRAQLEVTNRWLSGQ